jgi:hypothetical protein
MPWVQAAKVIRKLSVEMEHKEGLLDMKHYIYMWASKAGAHIANVGKAIVGL